MNKLGIKLADSIKDRKIAHDITGNRLKFVTEMLYIYRKTLKLKGFIMNQTQNLFCMEWIGSFNLLNQPINSFSYSVSLNTNKVEKSKKELMIQFPEIFSEGLRKCSKAKATFKIEEDVMPNFSPKRKVHFATEGSINKELDSLEKIGMLTKMDYSEWANPTVYMKKKVDKIRASLIF